MGPKVVKTPATGAILLPTELVYRELKGWPGVRPEMNSREAPGYLEVLVRNF